MYLPSKPTKAQMARAINDNVVTLGGRLLSSGSSIYSKAVRESNRLLAAVKILTTGPLGTELNYTDYRYWAQFEQNSITNAHYQIGDTINLQDNAKPITTIYNWSEFPAGTHSIAAGSIITVALFYIDQVVSGQTQAVPQLRWCVMGGGTGGGSTGSGQKKGMVLTDVTDNSTGFDYVRIVKTY